MRTCEDGCNGCDECTDRCDPGPGCNTPAGCRENGCLGWCDEHRPDQAPKPDIAALKKRLEEDPGFAAQVTGDRPLRRNVDGVCTRSTCECEREGLGDQCVWLKPAEAEFECLGDPSLCDNPRGCDCPKTKP